MNVEKQVGRKASNTVRRVFIALKVRQLTCFRYLDAAAAPLVHGTEAIAQYRY